MHAFGHYFFVPDEIYIIEIHLVLNSKDLHIHSWYNTSTSILLHIGLSLAKEKRQTLYDPLPFPIHPIMDHHILMSGNQSPLDKY